MLAEDLYGRLGTFVTHMNRMGRQLASSVENYNKAVGSLERSVLPGRPQVRRPRRPREKGHREAGHAGPGAPDDDRKRERTMMCVDVSETVQIQPTRPCNRPRMDHQTTLTRPTCSGAGHPRNRRQRRHRQGPGRARGRARRTGDSPRPQRHQARKGLRRNRGHRTMRPGPSIAVIDLAQPTATRIAVSRPSSRKSSVAWMVSSTTRAYSASVSRSSNTTRPCGNRSCM